MFCVINNFHSYPEIKNVVFLWKVAASKCSKFHVFDGSI